MYTGTCEWWEDIVKIFLFEMVKKKKNQYKIYDS